MTKFMPLPKFIPSPKFTTLLSIGLIAMLSGCAAVTTNTTSSTGQTNSATTVGTLHTVGMNLFKTAVDERCRREIEQNNMWQIARVAMTDNQQEMTKGRVCGCVSEQGAQQVSVIDIANASIDATYRAELVTKVVSNSLQTCYANAIK